MGYRFRVVYRVVNKTRGTILGDQIREARDFRARFIGLMGRDELSSGQGLHLVPCNSIHTLFMRIPIDLAFLDSVGTVLKSVSALPPWRATRIIFGARSVLELPAGTLQKCCTSEGDSLCFEEVR
jgi:uncharacterized membrane protein (UPF0127 family)